MVADIDELITYVKIGILHFAETISFISFKYNIVKYFFQYFYF